MRKCEIVTKIKLAFYRPIGIFKIYRNTKRRENNQSSKPRIFLLNVPSHGNLGDHLLSVAEQLFFKNNFPAYELVLVSSSALFYSIRFSLLDVNPSDILCITGGGFMGSMYEEETRILSIVKKFPDNKIVFLPQTFYYESSEEGKKQIEKAQKIYSNHKHLFVATRDEMSYRLLTNRLMSNFKHRIFLTPDMALYAHFPQSASRNGVVWCLRNDLEKNDSNTSIIQSLQSDIKKIGLSERYIDTYVNYSIPVDNEHAEVNKFISNISQAQLVITDRLHGMIYCVITNTPVIVLDNINHKVIQVYELWLKNIPFVKVLTEHSKLDGVISEMLCLKYDSYDFRGLQTKFKPIIDAINE